MTARLDYAWRFFATGMAFVVFGICGVLFSVLVFPLAWLWPHRASRQRAVTSVIHWFFRALVAVLQRIGVMELEVSGARGVARWRPGDRRRQSPDLPRRDGAAVADAARLLRREERALGQPVFLGDRALGGIREQCRSARNSSRRARGNWQPATR